MPRTSESVVTTKLDAWATPARVKSMAPPRRERRDMEQLLKRKKIMNV